MSKYHSGLNVEKISDVLKMKNAHIHFIGVGGVGMYPLFLFSEELGYSVSGSDAEESELFKLARQRGMRVSSGHHAECACGADIAVYSLAVAEDNPEILYCLERGIPAVSRAEYFGVLMRLFRERIAVAGSHGKSTVSAMLDAIFLKSGVAYTSIIGAALPDIKTPYRYKGLDTLIYEACEYKDSFLRFSPTSSLFLNLELDHVDYFESLDAIKKSFRSAMEMSELSIINGDDGNLSEIASNIQGRVVKFGMKRESEYKAAILSKKHGKYKVRFTFKKKTLFDVTLAVPGEHNIMNALAAAAAALEAGIEIETVKEAIQGFCGIERRLETIGSRNGTVFYYDYAHHPTEISASIRAVREMADGEVTVVFKPHTYSRTAGLMDELASALSSADRVYLSEIAAIREDEIYGVTSEVLASHIGDMAEYLSDENIVNELKNTRGGAVILMGAANIDYIKTKIMSDGEFKGL